MLLIGTRGETVEPGGDLEKLVCELKVGGLLLFDKDVASGGGPRNVRSMSQLSRLTRDLQALARRCGDAPLLIAADVEGGVVNHLSALAELSETRSPLSLGRGTPRGTFRQARRMAEVMQAAGVNWNLAPVVDLNLNPENPAIGLWGRSFSDDPGKVARHARAFIEGLDTGGVLNCLKHFPGHGSSAGDSHEEIVDVSASARPELELKPYRALIRAELVDCVMTAHIRNDRIDPGAIATFSSATIQGLLRGKLGYDGLVLSDDLQMSAVLNDRSLEEAAVLAVRAGTDMLTLSNNRNDYDDGLGALIHEALLDAVERGELPAARIRESSARILRLKAELQEGSP